MKLGDAIAVTIIATGFNVEQQNEISNTEVKKVVFTFWKMIKWSKTYLKQRTCYYSPLYN